MRRWSRRILAFMIGGRFAAAAALLLVTVAIAGNALLRQAGVHPSPLVVTRPAGGAASEPPAPTQDGLVQAVQRALLETGYYDGPLDGVPGPRTRSAIAAFERRAGRPVTGTASAELLAALQTPPPEERPVERHAAAEPHAAAPAPRPNPDIAAVQAALAAAAYGPLDADGVYGPATREAIVRFQRDHGLEVTGAIDAELVRRLQAIGAAGGA